MQKKKKRCEGNECRGIDVEQEEETSILARDLTRKLIYQIAETRSRNGKEHGFECTVINRCTRYRGRSWFYCPRMYKYNNGIRTTPTRAHAAHLHKIPCNFESWRWSCAAFTLWNRSNVIRCSGVMFEGRASVDLRNLHVKERKFVYDPFFYNRSTFVRYVDFFLEKDYIILLELNLPSWKIRYERYIVYNRLKKYFFTRLIL